MQPVYKPTYKTCKRCGRAFRVKPSHYDKKTYCGRECMRQDYRERMSGDNNPNFRDAGLHTCGYCGKTFHTYNKRALYCSTSCAKASPATRAKMAQNVRERWQRKPWSLVPLSSAPRPEKPPKQPKPPRPSRREDRSCVICSATFNCPLSVKKRTCSEKCRRAYLSECQKGARSHRWKGGRTKEATLIRTSAAYAEWRSAVFARDDYTCCICGSRGRRLAAHHIKLFSAHPELRLTVSNGITICWPCHGKLKCKESDHEALFTRLVAEKSS